MKHRIFFALTSFALLMTGCKAQTATGEQTPSTAPAPAVATEATNLSASQLLEQKLKKGMPYAELRKIVLADGWLPLKTEECKQNAGGESNICAELPELDACSGDGHCVMWFAEGLAMTQLRIDTYGDSRRWNTQGRENEFNAKSWEFSSSVSADTNVIACPSNDFEVFLKAFASDKLVQSAFTLPLIKVEDLVFEEGAALGNTSSYVKKSDYRDFDLKYEKDGFHVLDSDEKTDPIPTAIQINAEDADTNYVKYLYGMSEGNSYRFRKKKGCWYLAEDPDAPSS